MLNKTTDAGGNVVFYFPVPFLPKCLLVLVFIVLMVGGATALGVSMWGWMHKQLFVAGMGLILDCIALKLSFDLFSLSKSVRIVLSRIKITIEKGSKIYAAEWESLDPFECDPRTGRICAKVIGAGITDNVRGQFFTMPSIYIDSKDISVLLEEFNKSQQKV